MTILDFIRMTRANWKLLILAVAVGLAVMVSAEPDFETGACMGGRL